MNIKSVVAGALLIAQIATSDGQTNSFIVAHGITLPKDSTTQSRLLTALNGFLSQKDKPAKENAYVLKAHLLETSILSDEMKHVEDNNEFKQPAFYKCYLTNVMPLNAMNRFSGRRELAFIRVSISLDLSVGENDRDECIARLDGCLE